METTLSSAGLAGESSASSTLAITLANQFALMQQQMFDQMTQATMMMAQMFGQMQDKQMQLIREELGHLHQLTTDLHGLQAELLKHPLDAQQSASARTERAREVTAEQRKNEARAVAQQRSPLQRTPGTLKNARADATEPGASPPIRPVGAPTDQSQEDIHAVLCARIDALQQDRQSRWQKILQFMMGKRSAESSSPAE
jgi:hypothetical protein